MREISTSGSEGAEALSLTLSLSGPFENQDKAVVQMNFECAPLQRPVELVRSLLYVKLFS